MGFRIPAIFIFGLRFPPASGSGDGHLVIVVTLLHGSVRLASRRVFACPDVGAFAALEGWPGLKAVLAVETIRGINGAGKATAEVRHFISSAELPPETLATAIRRHWTIENGLRWVLDVGFGEDASRVRERNAARNLAVLRRIALNLARADGFLKASLKGKRKYAGWDDGFMALTRPPM